MTRVTNIVKRKRKYVSDDAPMVDRDSGEPSSSKRLKLEAGRNSSKSAFSKNAGKGGKVVKGLKGLWGHDGNLVFDNDADTDATDASLPADRAVASEQRRRRRVDERMASKTCFACRESGHTAKECPTAVGEGRSTVGICYKYATLGFSRSAIQIAYHHSLIMVLCHTKDAVRINTLFLVAESQTTNSTPFHSRNALCVHKRAIFPGLVRTTPKVCTLTAEAVNYAAKTIILRRTVPHGSQVYTLFIY